MKRLTYFAIPVVITTLLFFASTVPLALAQGRMSDEDIESQMKSLQDDAKRFRSDFDSAVGKSTIRNTTQEKEAKTLVETFQKQTEGMFKQFKDNQKADQTLPPTLASAARINKLLTSTPTGDQTNNDWAKVKTELDALSRQFNVTP